jgi:hypothetical protein
MKPRQPLIIKGRPLNHQRYSPNRQARGLLSVRSALVLALALLAAIGGAGLLWAAHRPPALMALGAVAIFAGALKLLDGIIE